MRHLLLCSLLFLSTELFAAKKVIVSQLSESIRPLAEAETNVAFNVGAPSDNKLTLKIELDPTVSNCVEVVFGVDENADGAVNLEEGQLCIGWDCGEWFLRDRRGDEMQRVEVAEGTRRLELIMRLNADKTPRFISGNIFSGRPEATCFNPDWNLMRIVSRGATSLAVESKMSVDALTVKIR